MKKYLTKLKYTLAVTSFFFILVGILSPVEIYAGNPYEFEFGFSDFFWMFLGIYGAVWIIGCLLISLLPAKINRIVCSIGFIIGLLCYLQNNFLNRKLMEDDGSSLNWSKLKTLTVINAIIWLVIVAFLIVIAIKLKDKWFKIIEYVALVIAVMQFVAIITTIIQLPKGRSYKNECRIDATNQFVLGSDENIIVFVLDKYSNKQFEINMQENPGLANIVKDFTYYSNANSDYEHTDFALAVMLAGQMPNGTETWREDAWSSKEAQRFYDILHEDGYETFISTRDSSNVFGKMETLVDKYDNVKVLDASLDKRLLFAYMTKMSIFKCVPYVAKPRFEVTTYKFKSVITPVKYENSLYIDPEFYQALCNRRFSVDSNIPKLFKVQHIQGMHGDYNMNGDAIAIPEENGTIEQSRAGMNTIIEEYLGQLKELGIYDKVTIIIVADHGDVLEEFGYQPLYLIKRSGETHDKMQENSAPIDHIDFIPTILDILGHDYSEFGTSIYDWNEGDRRERTVIFTHGDKHTYYTDGDELIKVIKQ